MRNVSAFIESYDQTMQVNSNTQDNAVDVHSVGAVP
jgi:hypothetical protein